MKINFEKVKKINPEDLKVQFGETYDKLQSNLPALIITCISAIIVMGFIAFTVFFLNVKSPEKVLVPNVTGKKLEDALLEMQVKELYPKITMRYSEVPGDEGTVLEQSPKANSIVKGYSRVSLVVSRGVIVDKVDNYVGQKIDDVQMKIQTLFAGQKALIVIDKPKYIPDTSEAGTILEQDPPAGTSISEPVTVQLVVSRGPNYENTRTPKVVGQSINDLLQTIARTKVVFDIDSRAAKDDEKEGVVVEQDTIDAEFVPNYTRIHLVMTDVSKEDDTVSGVFQENLIAYPYPVAMKLEAIPSEGDSYTIVSFSHPGGKVTIPYSVPHDTTLVLYVVDKVVSKKVVD